MKLLHDGGGRQAQFGRVSKAYNIFRALAANLQKAEEAAPQTEIYYTYGWFEDPACRLGCLGTQRCGVVCTAVSQFHRKKKIHQIYFTCSKNPLIVLQFQMCFIVDGGFRSCRKAAVTWLQEPSDCLQLWGLKWFSEQLGLLRLHPPTEDLDVLLQSRQQFSKKTYENNLPAIELFCTPNSGREQQAHFWSEGLLDFHTSER